MDWGALGNESVLTPVSFDGESDSNLFREMRADSLDFLEKSQRKS